MNSKCWSIMRAIRFLAPIVRFSKPMPISGERAIHVNIFPGTFLMTSDGSSAMVNRGWGRIVNITTSLDTMQRRHYSPYGVTKSAAIEAGNPYLGPGSGRHRHNRELADHRAARCEKPAKCAIAPRPVPEPPFCRSTSWCPALQWLASDLSNGETGGRYVGKLWDDLSLAPAEEAARKVSRAPGHFAPRIWRCKAGESVIFGLSRTLPAGARNPNACHR